MLRKLPLLLLAALALMAPSSLAQSPSVEFTSLLDGVKVHPEGRNPSEGGGLAIDKLTAVFMPPEVLYDHQDLIKQESQAYAVLRKAGAATELGRWPLINEPRNEVVFTGLRPVGGPVEHYFTEEGGYTLSIQIDDAVIAQLPFEVTLASSGDPFQPSIKTYITGPWADLACLRLSNMSAADGRANLKFWSRGGVFNESGADEKIEIEVRNEGHVVFAVKDDFLGKQPHQSAWEDYDNMLEFTKGDGGGPIHTSDLLKKDGTYQIVMRRQGELYGVYEFEVAGGRAVPHARSAFDHTPHTDFLCPRGPGKDRKPQVDLIWMDRLTGAAAEAALSGAAVVAAGPSDAELAAWRATSSAPADRPFAVTTTGIKARMDAHIAAGDGVVAFGTGSNKGVSFLRVGEDVEHTLPSGSEWSSSMFGVCGKKLILTRGPQVAVYDTETESLVEIPLETIHLARTYAPVYGASPLATDGNLVATLNDPNEVTDRRVFKVLDVSGAEPRVITLRNTDASFKDLTSIGIDAATGKLAVSWHREKTMLVGDVVEGAELRAYDLGSYDGVGRTSPLLVSGGRVFYFDAAGSRRLRYLDLNANGVQTVASLGRDGRHFAVHPERLAYMTDQSYGSNYHFVTIDLETLKPAVASNQGEPSPGNGNFGMGISVALTANGVCFLAGQGKSGVGSGEILQVLANDSWKVVAGPDGQPMNALDVTAGQQLVAFKTGSRNDTLVAYAVFGSQLDPASIPAAE